MATSVLAGELEDGKWKGKKLWFYKSLSGKVHWMFLHNLICLHTCNRPYSLVRFNFLFWNDIIGEILSFVLLEI